MSTGKDDSSCGGSEAASGTPAHAGSGKGASTALEALIRQRKLVETPDDPTLPPGSAPPAPAPPAP